MIDNIEDYIEPYVTFDKPIPYNELNLYPILVKDALDFISSIDILNIEKNKIPDVKIIQMNYLEFIFNLMIEDEIWRNKFIKLMNLVFHVELNEDFLFKEFQEKQVLVKEIEEGTMLFFNGYNLGFIVNDGKPTLYIEDKKIECSDFDDIKRLIMYQNINEYDDTPMSDDFKKMLEKYYALANKEQLPVTLNKKINAIMSQTGYDLDKIMNMSYLRFDRIFSTIIDEIDYRIGKMAEIQGATKKETEHWVYKKKKNKYEEAFTNMGTLKKL